MANTGNYPASGKTDTTGRPYSGITESSDPTLQPGQYPVTPDWGNAIFGGPLPDGTGAPGSTGGRSGGLDPTNEIGQVTDSFTGIPDGQIGGTGATNAPGTQGAQDGPGGTPVTYTMPQDGIGPYYTTTVSDDLNGPQDSTQANGGGYATGGPQLPGLKGNEPQAGSGRYQPGGGRVLRGGRAINP